MEFSENADPLSPETNSLETLLVAWSQMRAYVEALDPLIKSAVKVKGTNGKEGDSGVVTTSEPTQLEVVFEAVRAFGKRWFSLSDLCGKISQLHPELRLTRVIVSRRLFDLRRGKIPVVRRVPEHECHKDFPLMKRFYQYTGPP